jgi:hypothetical protein
LFSSSPAWRGLEALGGLLPGIGIPCWRGLRKAGSWPSGARVCSIRCWRNPANTVGVGPDDVVDFTNANAVVHDKKSGRVVEQMTQTEFWKRVSGGGLSPTGEAGLFEPKNARSDAARRALRRLGTLRTRLSKDPISVES